MTCTGQLRCELVIHVCRVAESGDQNDGSAGAAEVEHFELNAVGDVHHLHLMSRGIGPRGRLKHSDERHNRAHEHGSIDTGRRILLHGDTLFGITHDPEGQMYGLISKVNAVPGQRDALVAILLEGTQAMPGCLSYVIATDQADADALWITEVWDTQASHKASLSLPAVQAAIAKGRAMIAGFSSRVETVPIGGHGV